MLGGDAGIVDQNDFTFTMAIWTFRIYALSAMLRGIMYQPESPGMRGACYHSLAGSDHKCFLHKKSKSRTVHIC
jgi:hypothetical protein